MSDLDALLPIALDITASLSTEDRLRRLVEVVRAALPCDAAAILRLEDEVLVPIASFGLESDLAGRRFALSEHPRLAIVCASEEPTLFPDDSPLPDPYDGWVEGGGSLNGHVHSCLGCPLRVEGQLVGVLTVDALRPGAFAGVDPRFLTYLGALAGAALRTSDLIEALEERARRQGLVAGDVLAEMYKRRGGQLIGHSETMSQLRRNIELVAPSEFPVLVSGETGTGKELIVHALHAASRRADRPLVYVNCAALPESIAESELFGHAKGAFTGAGEARPGKFSIADGGSLFLDEVGELPLHLQPKFLRALQEGEVQRVGSDRTTRVDVRLFAATNRDLAVEVAAGRFRADLLHRLDVCRIQAPALREHPEDISDLAGHIADGLRRKLGTGPIRFGLDAQQLLLDAPWPGNVRELENQIARAALRAAGRAAHGDTVEIRGLDLEPHGNAQEPASAAGAGAQRGGPELEAGSAGAAHRPPGARSETPSLRASVDEHQRRLIGEAVERNGGNWSAAARELGLHRSNLHHLARRLGLR